MHNDLLETNYWQDIDLRLTSSVIAGFPNQSDDHDFLPNDMRPQGIEDAPLVPKSLIVNNELMTSWSNREEKSSNLIRHMKNHDAAPVQQGFTIFVKAE